MAVPYAGAPVPSLPDSFGADGKPLNTRDTRMLARAARKKWNIPEQVADVLPSLMFAMARGLRVDPLTKQSIRVTETGQLRAANALIAMVAQNEDLPVRPVEDDGEQELDLSVLTVEELRLLDSALNREQSTRPNP